MAVEKLQSFFGGVMTGIKPDLLPDFCSPSGQNAVIDRIAEQKGRVRRRKGAVARTCSPITGEPAVLGIFHFPTADQDQILVIADDGTLNVEGDTEFECPPPEIIVSATPSIMRFGVPIAQSGIPAPVGQSSMATPAAFKFITTEGTQPPEPFCVGGLFGTRFNEGGVIGDYFPGAYHSHNLSDEDTVSIQNTIGFENSYCVASITPGTQTWVRWYDSTPAETEYLGWSAEWSFPASILAVLTGGGTSLTHTIESEWGGPDCDIRIATGAVSDFRFIIEFNDTDNNFYSTAGDDVVISADTWYSIYTEIQYSTKVAGVVQADGYVRVYVGDTVVCEALNVKIESQPKTDSGGNNRVPGIYFAVMDKLDDICVTPF